jgi:putative DNA primase/helicase
MSVGEDLVARTLTMRIDANMEHPEFREFKFDPVKMVLEHRSEYVCDVFTILRAYIQAGKPKIEAMRPWVTFSDWSELIRAPLLWLGEDDPCDTCEEAAEDDPDTEQRAAIFEAWAVAFPGATPKTVAEILGFVGDNPHTPLAQALKNIPDLRARGGDFDDIASSGGGHGIDKDKFGLWLRSNRGRVIDNLKLDNKSKTAEKVKEGEKTKKAKKAKRAANWFVKEIH